MRICFSMNPRERIPMGGGAKFVLGFKRFLAERGHQVEFNSSVDNLPDVFFMFDPRPLNYSRNWLTIDHVRYIQDVLSIKTPIVHRVNDTDKHPGRPPNFALQMTELANRSNKVIFVSNWVREFYKDVGTDSVVIHNGVDKNLFKMRQDSKDEKLKLITHHWSTNMMKGWEYYKEIDNWLEDNKDVEFTIIGRIPTEMKFKNTTVIPAMAKEEIAPELQKANVYITASKYEACGNHYIEGVSSGLPLLFHEDGGGVWEMKEYGMPFSNYGDLFQKIEKFKDPQFRHSYYTKIVESFGLYQETVYEKYLEAIYEALG